MQSSDALHLLLLTHSQNEAESLVSLLRNAGRATRAHHVQTQADLLDQLQSKSWDLIIGYPKVGDLTYDEVLKTITRLNKDLPVIVINDNVDAALTEDCLRKGAAALVKADDSNILLLVIQQQLQYLRSRRELRALEVRMRETDKRCQSLLESSRDPLAYIHDGMHVFANQAYLDLFGYHFVDDLEGMPILDMIDATAQQAFKTFLKTHSKDSNQEFTSTGLDGEGQPFPMRMTFSPATYADEECTLVVIKLSNDNSELEEKLKEISARDLLTGLYNKPYLIEQLESATDKAVLKGAKGAVLCVNLDDFGRIKSEVGISLADKVITDIGNLIKNKCQPTDVIARVGEDIFACLRMGTDAESAMNFAETLRNAIEHCLVEVGNRTVTATARIGVALITETSSRPEDILQQAHSASDDVRKLKNHERGNGVCLYMPKENSKEATVNLEQVVTDAIRSNSFRLLFQPLISLRGDEIEHYEAFLRLKLPNGEELSAGEFFSNPNISNALKCKVDRWVILHTTKMLGEHRSKGHNTRMFINLSAASLLDASLPGWVSVAISTAKLPKGAVVLQFHEDDASRMLKQAQDFTQALLERGIPAGINRFGCALNPLNILKHLAVDYIKVDGSFTKELTNNNDAQTHLKQLLSELHEENKITIIPLVENATSVATLWQMGAHFIQGYYVQPPQAAMTFDFNDESEI